MKPIGIQGIQAGGRDGNMSLPYNIVERGGALRERYVVVRVLSGPLRAAFAAFPSAGHARWPMVS